MHLLSYQKLLRRLKVLVSYHTVPDYMAPLDISDNQVNCGPFYTDKNEDGKTISRQTPLGFYDIRKIIDSLPAEQKPELLIVKADATKNNFPLHIAELGIPSILIIGDTQHQKDPLQTLIRYAASEKYSICVADHVRRHLHYFIEAGIKNVFWAPAINLKNWNIPFLKEKKLPLSFIGQTGKFHPYRNQVIEGLKKQKDIEFNCLSAPQKEASMIYAASKMALNISMNGDVNLRAFEVLAAGGMLVTDSLRPQSGLELLFDPGIHLETFQTPDELYDKVRFYNKNPTAALKIAWNGHKEFLQSHTPKRKHQQLLDLAIKGWSDSSWNARKDKRSIFCNSPDANTFFNRIRNYELFQQKQLEGEFPKVLFSPLANPNLTCDMADLFHISIYSLAIEQKNLFIKTDVFNYITLVDSPETLDIETLILSADECKTEILNPLLACNPKKILVEDLPLVNKETKQQVIATLQTHQLLKAEDAPAIFINLS